MNWTNDASCFSSMSARTLIRRKEPVLMLSRRAIEPAGVATAPLDRRSKKIVSSGICAALSQVWFSSAKTHVSAVTRSSSTQFVSAGNSTGPYATLSKPQTR